MDQVQKPPRKRGKLTLHEVGEEGDRDRLACKVVRRYEDDGPGQRWLRVDCYGSDNEEHRPELDEREEEGGLRRRGASNERCGPPASIVVIEGQVHHVVSDVGVDVEQDTDDDGSGYCGYRWRRGCGSDADKQVAEGRSHRRESNKASNRLDSLACHGVMGDTGQIMAFLSSQAAE